MKKVFLILVLAPILFTACIGVQTDIVLNKNGSGMLNLTYTVSKKFAAMGTLDGNAHLNALAIGLEDFLRTVNSINGFKLKKHKINDTKENRIYTIQVTFADINALLKFLDESGAKTKILYKDNKTILRITLANGGKSENESENQIKQIDKGLTKTAGDILSQYQFGFSMQIRGAASSFKWLDEQGREIDAPALGEVKMSGNKISYNAGMDKIVETDETVILETSW